MPCTHPLSLFKRQNNETGKFEQFMCSKTKTPGRLTALMREGYVDMRTEVSCHQCASCRKTIARNKAIQAVDESTLHKISLFLTLTYSPENRPWPPNPVLKHHQKFMDRVRAHARYRDMPKVRYSCLREHGNYPNYRPHFHTILYGFDPGDLVAASRSKDGYDTVSSSKTIEKLWGLGFVHIGAVNPASAAYVSLHNSLKITGKAAELAYKNTVDPVTGKVFDRDPPKLVSSTQPPLGYGWYKKFKSDMWPSDHRIWNGHPVSIPRAYLELLEKEHPEEHAAYMERQKDKARELRRKNPKEQTPERREVRDKVLRARNKNRKPGSL